jgi:hypothetical protein
MTLLGILMARISPLKEKKILERCEFIILLRYGEIVELLCVIHPLREALKLSHILN